MQIAPRELLYLDNTASSLLNCFTNEKGRSWKARTLTSRGFGVDMLVKKASKRAKELYFEAAKLICKCTKKNYSKSTQIININDFYSPMLDGYTRPFPSMNW